MRLSLQLPSELILIAPDVSDREELLDLFGSVFEQDGLVDDASTVARGLQDREKILSTGIGGGVAVPHAQIAGLGRLIMAASTHPHGIDYPALDDLPVRLVFCLIGDSNSAADHLAGLARLARLARRHDALEELISARSGDDFLETLRRFEGE